MIRPLAMAVMVDMIKTVHSWIYDANLRGYTIIIGIFLLSRLELSPLPIIGRIYHCWRYSHPSSYTITHPYVYV